MKTTSASDAHCRIEDKVPGSVVIRNPFSLMLSLDPEDPLKVLEFKP